MRILIAAKRAPDAPGRRNGGVQTWCQTVANELRRIGHAVDVTGAADMPPVSHYDVGIFANAGHTENLFCYCDRRIVVSHGIVEDERPPADRCAFTSEGVKRHWGGAGPVIRQPIDTQFWSPDCRERSGMVRYAARGGLEWLPQTAAEFGMTFTHIRNASHEDAREALRGAAVVLASGRCAVEAMACGAPVVICDDRPYQGPLMGMSLAAQMTENYSGRAGIVPTRENVPGAIMAAIARGSLRGHVETHHDVRRVVAQLLDAAC